jgi:hypothetical protein
MVPVRFQPTTSFRFLHTGNDDDDAEFFPARVFYRPEMNELANERGVQGSSSSDWLLEIMWAL